METRRVQFDRERFLKEYTEWANDEETRKWRLKTPAEEAVKLVSDDAMPLDRRVELATKLGWIGPFLCSEGAVLCFTEPLAGWRLIKRGWLYQYWDHRISARARDFWEPNEDREDDSFALASELAETAAIGMAIARPEALWVLNVMELGLASGRVSWWDTDFFAAYLVRVYRKLRSEDDIKGIPLDAADWDHPFDDLIDFWHDEEKLASAIRTMCDYHLHWNGEDSEEHDAEFSAPYAMVNPIEIHALEAVRSELGLSMPKVEHELLQPPFYPLPEFAKNITTEEILEDDDLLRRIVEVNQPWCDGFED